MSVREYEAVRQQMAQELGRDIPEGVLLPERLPRNEFEWFGWIESLGAMQWRLNHDMADRRPWLADASGSVENVDNHQALREFQAALEFWAQVIAERCGLILPSECPPGNKTVPAGGEIPPFVRAILGLSAEITQVPFPPEGKRWWWDWYNAWKERGSLYQSAFYAEMDRLRSQVPEFAERERRAHRAAMRQIFGSESGESPLETQGRPDLPFRRFSLP